MSERNGRHDRQSVVRKQFLAGMQERPMTILWSAEPLGRHLSRIALTADKCACAGTCGRRQPNARLQQQDPREDPDARQGRDPDRDAQFRGRRADRRDHAEGLRQSRLPARRRGLPQLHSRRVRRSDAPGQRRNGRDQEQPGRHLRPVAGFQSAVPHRQHRHRLLHASSSTWRPTGRPSSRFRPAADPARSTTRSSASSSTWAGPAPTRARAAST